MSKKLTFTVVILLFLAIFLRLCGILYGLPLWLINDEPSTILGALKMLELKSIIPANHIEEMSAVLYYPPYISYLYLIPFSILILVQKFYHGVDFNTLSHILTQDLSYYFITARLISITVGITSLFLVYKTTLQVFRSNAAALFSLFLGATSLIHISLSFSARHWIFISLIYSIALFILTHPTKNLSKKYLLFYLTSAIGMGVSSISSLLFILPLLWHFYYEKRPFTDLLVFFKTRKNYLYIILIFFISFLPSILYPVSNGFLVDITTHSNKSILQALVSPFALLQRISFAEPVLIITLLIGSYYLLKNSSRILHIFIFFICFYSLVFYFLFRFESRFVISLFPFILPLAGYGFFKLWQKNTPTKVVVCILAIFTLVSSVSLSILAINNDSRIKALEWAEANLRKSDKVITYGSQLRLPLTHSAISNLRKVDENALRRIDISEEQLPEEGFGRFESLNVYTINNKLFLDSLATYIKDNHYQYLIYENSDSEIGKKLKSIINDRFVLIQSYGDNRTPYSIATSEFKGSILELIKRPLLGPQVDIYKILP